VQLITVHLTPRQFQTLFCFLAGRWLHAVPTHEHARAGRGRYGGRLPTGH
jgi:hypothetical protein